MFTDSKRLQQIIKNLLSNAFKFTHHGQVALSVHPAASGWSLHNDELNKAPEVLAFAVSDTGIGISPDKQQIVFEAFQQADGSTSRKYGGTGLGLAISRELSRLLGGEIRLTSSPGRGSTFTLYLPLNYTPPRSPRKSVAAAEQPASISSNRLVRALDKSAPTDKSLGNGTNGDAGALASVQTTLSESELHYAVNEAGDDRDDIRTGDRVLLIVENDLGFARFLLDTAREMGFKGLVTSLGATALALTREYKPHAITLDIYLPDIAGWRVLERLKNDMTTRHTPVCVISTDESRAQALASGALAFIAKPIQSKDLLDKLLAFLGDFIGQGTKNLLVIESDKTRQNQIVECIKGDDVAILTAENGPAAHQILDHRRIDCLVVGSPTSATVEDIEQADSVRENSFSRLPVIVYDNDETDGDVAPWKRLGEQCTVCQVRSADRLLDMSSYFLHRDVARLPDAQRQVLLDLHESDKILDNKKVLIVDDDMRNIFALSSVLEEHEMIVLSADNGRDAIRVLQTEPDVDIVLMDIMMPEMDGMETMREIRKDVRLKNLPIIAVTAKAMKGDREKCIEAGAWDYLSKPVDTEQMLAVLRAWLHR
jgi:CheY-like chemotaxis protein